MNIILSLLNIKLNSVIKAAATTKFEIIASTKPSGVSVNDIKAENASPLPSKGIANKPTAGAVVNIENTPKRIITIIKGAINELASFTLFANAYTIENREIMTSTTETIRPSNIK